ncbi:Barwin-like endoglucanase [Cynara cardunculus var. scolymus]|uniref:Barwin-like endoglucanase n=1 Tax=Cynara cardunculus var. scolymus TaxID=59895 RepID=A0A118K0G6_CYNCS|nr:Barwin-like endoglucanase [Cynara cardunculus var. scolymus]
MPVASTCFGSQDKGVMISKAHSGLFANGSACGRRYRVHCISGTNKAIRNACTGNSVDVMVIDRCNMCAVNQLELSEEAFAKIARVELGRVNVEYEQYLYFKLFSSFSCLSFSYDFLLIAISCACWSASGLVAIWSHFASSQTRSRSEPGSHSVSASQAHSDEQHSTSPLLCLLRFFPSSLFPASVID